jgi:hypothetical protein
MSDELEKLTLKEERELRSAIKSLEGSEEDKDILANLREEVKTSLEAYPNLEDKKAIEDALRKDSISAMKELAKAKTPKEKEFLKKGAAASAISANEVHKIIEKEQKRSRVKDPVSVMQGVNQSSYTPSSTNRVNANNQRSR